MGEISVVYDTYSKSSEVNIMSGPQQWKFSAKGDMRVLAHLSWWCRSFSCWLPVNTTGISRCSCVQSKWFMKSGHSATSVVLWYVVWYRKRNIDKACSNGVLLWCVAQSACFTDWTSLCGSVACRVMGSCESVADSVALWTLKSKTGQLSSTSSKKGLFQVRKCGLQTWGWVPKNCSLSLFR